MRLYTFWRSSAAYRVRIALHLKRLAYVPEARRFALREHRAPEYLVVNPQGLLPALELEGGEVLTQSLAILEFLDERYPTAPLLPGDALGRARVRAMAQAIACDLHPLNNLRVLEYLRTALGQPEDAVADWYRHWVAETLAPLETLARRHSGDGAHLYGTRVTLADVCLVPQLYNARRFAADLSPYPTLVRIDSALREVPAFVAARPEAQPDAV